MTLKWLPVARQELEDALAWYEDQQTGLGGALLDELARALDLIEKFPHAWHPLTQRIRRLRLNRFPYSVVYASFAGEWVVLALAHQHRRPFYWRSRVTKE